MASPSGTGHDTARIRRSLTDGELTQLQETGTVVVNTGAFVDGVRLSAITAALTLLGIDADVVLRGTSSSIAVTVKPEPDQPPVAVPGPASEPICPGCKRPVSECQAEDVDEAPGPASVSPAEPPEAESDRMLLVALGMLLSWRVVRYEENMGGGWFSASEIGTHPIRADEVRRLYAKESEARRDR